MRKKNLSVKVAALAMSGTLAMAPMTVRAEEVAGTTATESTGITATTSTTAAPVTAPAASTATSGATTAAPTIVTVAEDPAAPGTTAPNNANKEDHVDRVVKNDKQGTDISAKAETTFFGLSFPVANVDTTISSKDADEKGEQTIADSHDGVEENALTALKNKEVVMQGDLSIKKEGSTENLDTTTTAPHDVKKEDSYSLQADLDVSAVNNAINKSADVIPNAKDIWVNNLETGLRATFEMAANLDGSFHLPSDLEDAKRNYELSSADGNPLIYRINYANSYFKKDKVTIAMDLDLTQMGPLVNRYSTPEAKYKNLYGTDSNTGKANHIENFNHADGDYGTYYQTSTLGNLKTNY
ncbi:hypothetical protein [Oribacterium parvum]|uniref:hypothetical protein n=1 Tax=Oribacterium parvum TaxID=1501329 RepID=UPI0028E7953C|nr:hypothetical protein [Oribacterium parvum]